MIDENKLKKAILEDFKELLNVKFAIDWEVKRYMIEMYLSVMSLNNTIAYIEQVKGSEDDETN